MGRNIEAERMLAGILARFEAENRARQAAAAKADPHKHKLTRIMDRNTNYTFWRAGSRKLKRRQFDTLICVSKHRNAAGNFLIWRQVNEYRYRRGRLAWHQSERFDFKFSNSKRDARECAERWAARLNAAAAAAAIAA
jgi:hypothetical protein